jgi:hypothetical protein
MTDITNYIKFKFQYDQYDVFLSYRVNSDKEYAKILYDHLVGAELTVWFDSESIKHGDDWRESFCRGLVCSRNFVCLISRDSINHPGAIYDK